MPWVTFSEAFYWHLPGQPGVTQVHAAGGPVLVKREVADAAIEAGKATIAKRPKGDDGQED